MRILQFRMVTLIKQTSPVNNVSLGSSASQTVSHWIYSEVRKAFSLRIRDNFLQDLLFGPLFRNLNILWCAYQNTDCFYFILSSNKRTVEIAKSPQHIKRRTVLLSNVKFYHPQIMSQWEFSISDNVSLNLQWSSEYFQLVYSRKCL